MTKSDLKTGMIATLRNGIRCIVIMSNSSGTMSMLKAIDQLGLICGEYFLTNYNDNLERTGLVIGGKTSEFDVMRVDGISSGLIWERKEKKKYTYSQLKEILGEEFEIVKE